MPYYYNNPYPPPYFVPEPWRTTYVPRHYPETHYPLEHFRHSVSHTLSNVADTIIHPFEHEQPIHNPCVDVRESKGNYYIDIELPGLESKDKLRIRWASSQTFLVETTLETPKIDEDDLASEEATGSAAAVGSTPQVNGPSNIGEKNNLKFDGKDDEKGKDVALTVHERRVGSFARAFSFPTGVSHEKLEATLHAGLLRLKVPKKDIDDVKPEHKEVEVKHSGA